MKANGTSFLSNGMVLHHQQLEARIGLLEENVSRMLQAQAANETKVRKIKEALKSGDPMAILSAMTEAGF